ncbi:hypothetical protein Mapa_003993 [Marchantia paleacea]|nr:hypothetical protein Mapa_003993 [Marchantia paleacea]
MGMRSEYDAGYSARRTFTVLQVSVSFFCLLSLQTGESTLVPDGGAIDNNLRCRGLMRKPQSVSDQNTPPQFPHLPPPPTYRYVRGRHPPWAPKTPTAVSPPRPPPPPPPCCRDPNHPLPPPISRGPPPPPFPHPPPPPFPHPPPSPFPLPPRTNVQNPPPPTIRIAPPSIRAPMTPPARAPVTPSLIKFQPPPLL